MKKNKPRDYKREYEIYHGKPKQRKRRSERNKARALAIKEGRARKGDGKDVHHKGAITNPRNTQVKSKTANRSFSRKNEKGHGKRGK